MDSFSKFISMNTFKQSKMMIKIVLILLILPSLCFSTIRGLEPRKPLPPIIFPDAVFEIQETTGFYSKEEIEAVADSNMLDLRSIYFKYLKKETKFKGDILIKFTIDKNGKVADFGIIHSTTENAEFDEAIKNKITDWKLNVAETFNGISSAIILFKFTSFSSTSSYSRKTFINSGDSRPLPEITQVLNARIIHFRSIYKKYLNLKPGLNGSIVLRFTIAASGEVANVDIVASTTEYSEFDEAIRKEFSSKFKWKPIEDGNITVTTIFNFQE